MTNEREGLSDNLNNTRHSRCDSLCDKGRCATNWLLDSGGLHYVFYYYDKITFVVTYRKENDG